MYKIFCAVVLIYRCEIRCYHGNHIFSSVLVGGYTLITTTRTNFFGVQKSRSKNIARVRLRDTRDIWNKKRGSSTRDSVSRIVSSNLQRNDQPCRGTPSKRNQRSNMILPTFCPPNRLLTENGKGIITNYLLENDVALLIERSRKREKVQWMV
jgi:hypothetical protein